VYSKGCLSEPSDPYAGHRVASVSQPLGASTALGQARSELS